MARIYKAISEGGIVFSEAGKWVANFHPDSQVFMERRINLKDVRKATDIALCMFVQSFQIYD